MPEAPSGRATCTRCRTRLADANLRRSDGSYRGVSWCRRCAPLTAGETDAMWPPAKNQGGI